MKIRVTSMLREIFLFLCVFFNPMGFDIIIRVLLSLTGSYWFTIGILYIISGIFFLLYKKYDNRLLLTTSYFFLPFGYDILFKITMDYYNSYWIATCIFYIVSGICFLLYLLFNYMNKRYSKVYK